MNDDKFVPIPESFADELIRLLNSLIAYPAVRHVAGDMLKKLGDAKAIAGEHRTTFELWTSELLCEIAAVSGRQFDTTPSPATLAAAKAALAEMGPVLGSNVLPFPAAPSRETQAAIEAAAQGVLDRQAPPLAAVLVVDGRQLCDAVNMWAVPAVGHLMHFKDGPAPGRYIVRQVCWLAARVVEIQAEKTWPAKDVSPELREVGP